MCNCETKHEILGTLRTLEALLAKSSGGSWYKAETPRGIFVVPTGDSNSNVCEVRTSEAYADRSVFAATSRFDETRDADAELIIALHKAAPGLINELREALFENKALRERMADLETRRERRGFWARVRAWFSRKPPSRGLARDGEQDGEQYCVRDCGPERDPEREQNTH